MKCLPDIEVIGGQVHPVPKLSLQNPLGFEKIVERLQDIENILGDTYDLDRLRELVEADKAGKAMIFPVKPGEYIYLISLDSEIVPCRVGNIAAEEWGMSFEGAVEGFGPYRTGPNEKVFFSREAAESALKSCMGKEKSNG